MFVAPVFRCGISETAWNMGVDRVRRYTGAGINVNDKSAGLASPLVMMLVSPFLTLEMMMDSS